MKRRAFLRGLGAAGGLAFAPALATAAPGGRDRVLDRLRAAKINVVTRASAMALPNPYKQGDVIDVTLETGRTARRAGRSVALTVSATPAAGRADAVDLASGVRMIGQGLLMEHRIGLTINGWSKDNYVLLPGACYAGNRFQSRRAAAYPPLLTERADIGPHVPPIIPAIPRLNAQDGPSQIDVDATDLTTPAAAVLIPAARLGLIVLAPVAAAGGRTSFAVWENADRSQATISVETPFALDRTQAFHAGKPERERGVRFPAGGGLALTVRVVVFDCADVPALFERLFALRKELTGPTRLVHELPFSAAFATHEARVNKRWVDKPGFYAVGARDTAYSTWQTGWCGGSPAMLPLVAAGGKLSRERALATIAYAVEGQAPSGFFHGISDGKTWTDDGFAALMQPAAPPPGGLPVSRPAYKQARRWHLVRRSADALTFLVKQLMLLERRPMLRADARPEPWGQAARRAADALVRLWERYKQLGQFVDIESGELIVGGSTAAGLAPAGLALAATYFKEPRYLQAAKAIGEQFYERFVRVGLTCGGPGDALQAPDSQSAAALLESFVTLHEATREPVWIDRARAAAHLYASWVVAYDTPAAGRECDVGGQRATGAVLWDAASRRGSPGIVISSGDALLRLYRATGDPALLELLRDTVHNLAQYLSVSEAGLRLGTPACARTDTGRWFEPGDSVVPVDSVFDAIALLSYTEVPGIYVRPDTGFVFVFDHVTARIKDRTRGHLVLAIANPTRADATVRILSETAADVGEPLHAGAVLDAQTAVVPAGASVQVSVPPL